MTRNQEVDNTLKSHDKAIADIQTALAALMKQQEQSSKQQEEILKAVRDKGVQSSGSSFGSFSGPDGDSRTSKPFRIGDALQWHRAYLKTRNATVAEVPWADYVRSISARFSDAMFEDPMEEIASLVQLTDNAKGLQEYNSGFDRLLNKVTVSEPYAGR
uniref:Retrotransposon gag domain-containing protein n=1 Tax=Helianthus annuus TaxID=4232 RepID=A0A251THB0_HELAN